MVKTAKKKLYLSTQSVPLRTSFVQHVRAMRLGKCGRECIDDYFFIKMRFIVVFKRTYNTLSLAQNFIKQITSFQGCTEITIKLRVNKKYSKFQLKNSLQFFKLVNVKPCNFIRISLSIICTNCFKQMFFFYRNQALSSFKLFTLILSIVQ